MRVRAAGIEQLLNEGEVSPSRPKYPQYATIVLLRMASNPMTSPYTYQLQGLSHAITISLNLSSLYSSHSCGAAVSKQEDSTKCRRLAFVSTVVANRTI
ncbi:hypothetical protein VYU27_000796 [Nannochloropsis oceanica]